MLITNLSNKNQYMSKKIMTSWRLYKNLIIALTENKKSKYTWWKDKLKNKNIKYIQAKLIAVVLSKMWMLKKTSTIVV